MEEESERRNMETEEAAAAGEGDAVASDPIAAGRDEMEIEEGGQDDDGDGGEEEGEDGEEEEEYSLWFEGEMNPLDFAEEDAFGVEPYQHFERLEYEALAEKKRRAIIEQQRQLRRCGGEPVKKKPRQVEEETYAFNFDEIMEAMTRGGSRRKSRKPKKRGRRKGSKNKLSPEITRKLGDATLHYASGSYDEAIRLLEDVVRLAPNLPDPYHTLGLIHDALGDRKKALNFYMIAAHLTPKDPSLWKLLVAWSMEQGNTGQVRYCLSKAITADPDDVGLRLDRALLYIELGEYQKSAESYDQIVQLWPANVEARKMAAEMYRKCGQVERAIQVLEEYVNGHSSDADHGVVRLLATLLMENNDYNKALEHIEHARSVCCSAGRELPLFLTVKAGVCFAYLGNMETAEILFQGLQKEHAGDNGELINEVADAFSILGFYDSALKFYLMLDGTARRDSGGPLQLKIARCYLCLKQRAEAILFFYKALSTMEDNIDARITLSSLLLEEEKLDDAIVLLSPPKSLESFVPVTSADSMVSRPWWLSGRVRMQLARIYHGKGMLEEFVDAIFSSVRETLFIESTNEKVRIKKRLTRSVLFERVKLLDDHQDDNIFHGFKPIAPTSDLLKASRAKKLLQKKAAAREKRKAAALAAGMDWLSEESEDESPQKALGEPPLPNLLKDEEHYRLILDLCKALASLRRYWEALDVINHTLRLAYNTLSIEKKEELRSLGAQIAYNTTDPKHGYDCVRYVVQQNPYSIAAWNCYNKVVSKLDHRYPKHGTFMKNMKKAHKDCVPPTIIRGNQHTMVRQHQKAARKYLKAHKLLPGNPLIHLCIGTALINLAHDSRLQDKHLCVLQGFAFLINYLHICRNSQEAFYNIARAYQHVGHPTLAASYYEKVLAIEVKDYPIPKLPNEDPSVPEILNPGYCNLHKEAAYNLHLIYKKSGAVDLARQVLKNYCNP